MMDNIKKHSNSEKNTLITNQAVSVALPGKSILHDIKLLYPALLSLMQNLPCLYPSLHGDFKN
jgi:hypothetical protein